MDKQDVTRAPDALRTLQRASEDDLEYAKANGSARDTARAKGQQFVAIEAIRMIKAWYVDHDE